MSFVCNVALSACAISCVVFRSTFVFSFFGTSRDFLFFMRGGEKGMKPRRFRFIKGLLLRRIKREVCSLCSTRDNSSCFCLVVLLYRSVCSGCVERVMCLNFLFLSCWPPPRNVGAFVVCVCLVFRTVAVPVR